MPRWMWRLAGFSREPGKMPQAMRKRLAYDEGKEMARHKELSKALTLNVYLCDPHAPRQRPSNGNMNGPVRRHLPKGFDLSPRSRRYPDRIALRLNTRPRVVTGFRMPPWYSRRTAQGWRSPPEQSRSTAPDHAMAGLFASGPARRGAPLTAARQVKHSHQAKKNPRSRRWTGVLHFNCETAKNRMYVIYNFPKLVLSKNFIVCQGISW